MLKKYLNRSWIGFYCTLFGIEEYNGKGLDVCKRQTERAVTAWRNEKRLKKSTPPVPTSDGRKKMESNLRGRIIINHRPVERFGYWSIGEATQEALHSTHKTKNLWQEIASFNEFRFCWNFRVHKKLLMFGSYVQRSFSHQKDTPVWLFHVGFGHFLILVESMNSTWQGFDQMPFSLCGQRGISNLADLIYGQVPTPEVSDAVNKI